MYVLDNAVIEGQLEVLQCMEAIHPDNNFVTDVLNVARWIPKLDVWQWLYEKYPGIVLHAIKSEDYWLPMISEWVKTL